MRRAYFATGAIKYSEARYRITLQYSKKKLPNRQPLN